MNECGGIKTERECTVHRLRNLIDCGDDGEDDGFKMRLNRNRWKPVDGEFSVVAANSENRRYLARPEPVPRFTQPPGTRYIQSVDTSRVSLLAQAQPSHARHAAIGV